MWCAMTSSEWCVMFLVADITTRSGRQAVTTTFETSRAASLCRMGNLVDSDVGAAQFYMVGPPEHNHDV